MPPNVWQFVIAPGEAEMVTKKKEKLRISSRLKGTKEETWHTNVTRYPELDLGPRKGTLVGQCVNADYIIVSCKC